MAAKKLTENEQAPSGLDIPLIHVFGLATAIPETLVQDLRILTVTAAEFGKPPVTERGDDHQKLHDLVAEVRPDVVIFDTLIQMHDVNENDNILMKKVMRSLREITTVKTDTGTEEIAHIVVHHTRKESAQFRAPLSPEIMRGAGSIHGTADLVMLARPEISSGTIEIHISSRSSSIPNFNLRRDPKTLTHEIPKTGTKVGPKERKREFAYQYIIALLTDRYDTVDVKAVSNGLKRNPEARALKVGTGIGPITDYFGELVATGDIEMDPPGETVDFKKSKFGLTAQGLIKKSHTLKKNISR